MILPHHTSPAEREVAAALETCVLQGLGGERVNVKKQRVCTATCRRHVLSAPFSSGHSFFGRGLTDQDWKKILGIKKRV